MSIASTVAPSFWHDQLAREPPRTPLDGRVEADVCVVGGGFTGLWTAYELKRAEPGSTVVVLEAEQVGFGASGRNGGWVLGVVSGSPSAWQRRGGPDAPRRMSRAIQDTVAEIGATVTREQINCDWHHGGSLTVAQNQTQLERIKAELEHELVWAGEDCARQLLDATQLAQRVRVDHALGAVYTQGCARIQPAALVRGLARAIEAAGATIHEASRVTSIAPHRVHTAGGEVRSRHILVATEGYTADLPERHRALLPLNSSMIVTEPLDASLWRQLGWENAETMLDGSHMYTYSQRTADGRVAIGGRGVPYRFGSRTDREGAVPARTVTELRERLEQLFPALHGVGIDRAWHGVLGVSRDWCPTVSLDRASGLGYAGGYAGEGVAASNLAARTLRDLVLGRDSELTRLPWVDSAPRPWEPEPLRFLGARGIYALYREADRREAHSGHASRVAKLATVISGR